MGFDIDPYDPCPCGSGKKYKFCCAEKAKANRHGKFPIGTVAYYGPDDKTFTKVAAGVILSSGADPIIKRWKGENVHKDMTIAQEIKQFFAKYGVKSAVITDGILGCPHEEGIDYPDGSDCPECPFWAGKQGSARRDLVDSAEEDDEDISEDEEDLDEEDDDDEEERNSDAAFERFNAVIGDEELDRGQAVDRVLAYLQINLQLPCEVTGIEDFNWEEPYVFGAGSPGEYKRLKKTQPSYRDRYQLLSISHDEYSEWMLFYGEDISAHVRRISDGKQFVLGLAELKATDKKSLNYQLLDDYAVWFVNSR